MKNKFIIATFILSILALAASGVSLWLNMANMADVNVPPANFRTMIKELIPLPGSPPANSEGWVTIDWDKDYNDKALNGGAVFLLDINGNKIAKGIYTGSNVINDTYNYYIFQLDSEVLVRQIIVGDIATQSYPDGYLIEPNVNYVIDDGGEISEGAKG